MCIKKILDAAISWNVFKSHLNKMLEKYVSRSSAMAAFIGQWRFISQYFANQIEFDLQSTYKEFLLLLKSLNKNSIQYFTIEFSV